MNTSHELAAALRQVAEKLEATESFNLPGVYGETKLELFYVSADKEDFLKAAKHVGGNKNADYFYALNSTVGPLTVRVQTMRDAVCHKVKKIVPTEVEVWECDPLLSAADLDARDHYAAQELANLDNLGIGFTGGRRG